MRIIFMGSADISCVCLEALCGHEILTVVTQPDRPKGRKLVMSACEVKSHALNEGYHVISPDDVNSEDNIARLKDLEPDLIVVVAYGQILKKKLIELPEKGCINLHTSLLPEYRGAAPVQRAIIDGCMRTGVTTMYMNQRMDAGDIIDQKKVEIMPEDTASDLMERLSLHGADLLKKTLGVIEAGTAPRRVQNEADATYAPKLKKSEGQIDWANYPTRIYNKVRGMIPWPCAFCHFAGKRLEVLKVRPVKVAQDVNQPGMILGSSDEAIIVGTSEGSTGNNAVELLRVKPAGKREMSGADFARGMRFQKGCRFE